MWHGKGGRPLLVITVPRNTPVREGKRRGGEREEGGEGWRERERERERERGMEENREKET